ncbi:MAG: hypothetical protein HS115_03135 [Spirochaetales bacterium]|nr:hypothetical protein [Spirochaetales bacterium]
MMRLMALLLSFLLLAGCQQPAEDGNSGLLLASLLVLGQKKSSSSRDVPIVAYAGDSTYLSRAQTALNAWSIDLATNYITNTRYMGNSSTAHHPNTWITTATNASCSRKGVDTSTLGTTCLSGAVIGVCETRYTSSGQIVDITAVMEEDFQDGGDTAALKQAVFSHEIGHCLGLKHVDGAGTLIMHPDTTGATTPHANELAAVSATYEPCCTAPTTHINRFTGTGNPSANGSTNPTGNSIYWRSFPVFYIYYDMGNTMTFAESMDEAPRGEVFDEELITVHHYLMEDGTEKSYRVYADGRRVLLR